ncbi:MAG: protein-methionine-sulfoxide reductase heme-binding subunit MsrQ [Pseudomonadota bacterium]
MKTKSRDALGKTAVFTLASLPFLDGLWRISTGSRLGGNPVETLEHLSGEWAVYLLLVTLAMTPARQLFGWRWPLKVRRMLGLFSAFYVALHIACYLWLDLGFAWDEVWRELTGRPTITVGAVAALGMTVLAVTSPKIAVRKLGRRWLPLHRSVYLVAVLAVVHVAWKGKDGDEVALLYGVLLIALLLPRFGAVLKRG